MKNPWKDIDKAFNPMFDEDIIVRYVRGNEQFSQTVKAVVYTAITGEPISIDCLESERQDININVRKCDYSFITSLQGETRLSERMGRSIQLSLLGKMS